MNDCYLLSSFKSKCSERQVLGDLALRATTNKDENYYCSDNDYKKDNHSF